MAEFERIEKVSYLRIFTHNINKRKFMISCCDKYKNKINNPTQTLRPEKQKKREQEQKLALSSLGRPLVL